MGGAVHLTCSNCPHECSGVSAWKIVREYSEVYGAPELLNFGIKCPHAGQIRGEDETGVPKDYINADFPQFDFSVYGRDVSLLKNVVTDFFEGFEEWEKHGRGLYLWSNEPGSGKTLLACSLARSIMIRYDLQMKFVTAPDYLSLVGNSYKRMYGEEDCSRVYRSCRLLVLDDLGSQKNGDWQNQELFSLINERQGNGLITIFTSNIEPEKLNIGDRSINRLTKATVPIHMPEISIRSIKAEEDTRAFLKRRGIIK